MCSREQYSRKQLNFFQFYELPRIGEPTVPKDSGTASACTAIRMVHLPVMQNSTPLKTFKKL